MAGYAFMTELAADMEIKQLVLIIATNEDFNKNKQKKSQTTIK